MKFEDSECMFNSILVPTREDVTSRQT